VTLLAVLGVLFSTFVTAALVYVLLGLGWAVALLFGALIASTDPIAVVSLFRDLGAPRRLALLVEGESLFNDGAAITLFSIVLAAIITGQFSITDGVLRFLVTVIGALAVGAAIGAAGSWLLRAVDNPQIQITTTVIAAYGSYLLAEQFGFSRAIAVVVSGLLVGN
jgi:CPA1 family monovalent cation:H+ antiporter